jgi:nifR3 family TIM-barrel protein
MNFWEKLEKPFFVLAPMEDVTDAAFRTLIAKYSDEDIPRVFYTEFTAADGLMLADEDGQRKLRKKLEFSEAERPIVAQLFSSKPKYMEAAAKLCAEMGFDGIDINMGCPADPIVKQGCGAGLIRTPALARELMRAVRRGAPSLPLSVKTRIGYNVNELETWLPELLAEEPEVVIIHARTRKEMSDVPARWEHVARAVEIRDALESSALIVGNGDLKNLADAREKIAATKADGAMLGRAIFGNPWMFSDTKKHEDVTPKEKIATLIEHIGLFQQHMSGYQNDAVMKRHFKAYIGGWDGAKELRVRLMDAPDLQHAREILAALVS